MSAADDRELRRASVRLAVQFAALILVLFAILGVVVYALVAGSQAVAAQRALQAASMVDSPHDVAHGSLVTISDDSGVHSSPDLPKGLPDQAAIDRVQQTHQDETSSIDSGGQTYLVLTSSRQPGRVVQAAVGLREQQEELARLVGALVIGGVLAAAAAAGLSMLMARRAMRPLADALALQRRFVADASHELRTPLTLLSTRAQLVRRRLTDGTADDAAVADGIDEIVADSRALTEIVEDLLIAADPRENAHREPVDLADVAAASVRSALGTAEERGVTIAVKAAGPVVVSGAPVSLRRLVIALLDNAIDHARSAIVVQVTAQGKEAVLRVSDDGPGFPGVDAGRAFERFASARSGEAPPGDSRHYGLGLALVAEVTSRHGGSVDAANDGPEGGAAVTVRLPRVNHP